MHKHKKPTLLLLTVTLLAVGATVAAQTSPTHIKFEAESGNRSNNTEVISDIDASGGQALSFFASVTPPPGALSQIPNPARPTVETVAYADMSGDIADDMALWPHPNNPALSVVIGANKAENGGGVAVFDMAGQILQFRKDGYIGNIDIRGDFSLGGRNIILVGANNRGNDTMTFWEYNQDTRSVTAPLATQKTLATQSPNYGFCFYRSAISGKMYAFVTPNGSGQVRQYEIFDNNGRIDATQVRTLNVSSITESCVADDERGILYIGQEDEAVWRYNAEPENGSTRIQVAGIGSGNPLTDDIEGMAIAYGPDNTGYLVVSSQGNSTFAIFDRGTNAFIRSFSVPSNGTIDAASSTDGLDINTKNFGPGFEKGVLVVHDENNSGGSTSNLKYIPLQ